MNHNRDVTSRNVIVMCRSSFVCGLNAIVTSRSPFVTFRNAIVMFRNPIVMFRNPIVIPLIHHMSNKKEKNKRPIGKRLLQISEKKVITPEKD